MEWNDKKGTEEEALLIELRQGLDRMDVVLEQPSIPSKEYMKDHIEETLQKRRKSMLLELLLFWLVSIFVIGSGTLLAYSAPWSLWLIQGIGFSMAVGIVIRFFVQRRKEGME